MSDFDISGVVRIDTRDLDAMAGRIGGTAKKIGGALAAAFAVDKMLDWGKAGLKAAGDYEQSEIAFTSLMGSAEKAKVFMQEMRDFVVATPFEFPGLADAARKLLGYGFAAKEVIPIMTDIGNVASALGVSEQGINGFVRALGQMRGKGKVSADEIRQISENIPGFNAAASIAASKGISVAETYKLMEKGAIPASEGIEAIITAMHNYPGAAGAMDRQNKTLLGSLNMLKETVRFAAVDVFEPYMPAITGALRATSVAVGATIVPALVAGSKYIFAFAGSVRALAGEIGERLAPTIRHIRAVLEVFATGAVAAWGRFAAAFQSPEIIRGADAVDDRISRLGSMFGRTFSEMSDYVSDWVDKFVNGWKHPGLTEGPDAIDDRVTRLSAQLKGLLNGIKRQFQLFGMGVRGAVTLDDTKPMYRIGEAVTNMGKTIQDNGPMVIQFWKNDLMPVLERVGVVISDNIIPIIGGLSAAFTALRIIGPIMAIASVIGTVISAVSGFVGIFGSIGGVIAALGGPVTIAIVAIGALVAGLIYAYQHSEKFREVVGRVATYAIEQFGNLVAFGKEIWPQLAEAIGHVMTLIGVSISNALIIIGKLWSWFGDDIIKIAGGAFQVVRSVVEVAVNTIANIIRLVLAVINGDWGKAWQAMRNIVDGISKAILGILKGLFGILVGIFGAGYEVLKQAALGTFGIITDVAKGIAGGMVAVGVAIVGGIVQGLRSAGAALKEAMGDLVDMLPKFVKDALGIRSPSRVFERLGREIPAGFAKGILGGEGMVSDAMGALTNVGNVSFGAGMAGLGAGAGGGGTTVVIEAINLYDANDPTDVRWQTELVGAIRSGVGKR